ncbi:uncharacterized protein LOC119871826 isoform X3 [Canis lupus familiaris]|uniref:uncharacterized protein LOC119871826 isoform X3 n=1 Tax=Canis lupus familiaris TaxID=9615 RepID=UPI0018F73C9D|nr:uncharacterized protein LOC119871826 isoform X3 [Canis lupus familiaris]XP_038368188.1 uncharacterized protein LOC119871826 isoform X3 [Canis lupus familiaris]XP_038368192.1 uncharacterized protein LOC119871826 isoform X3 [Canis lupus familiaris]XP_038368197.1 uncharacterized protein LOC119871826 isoform X3 [Canis lupus familiaris]
MTALKAARSRSTHQLLLDAFAKLPDIVERAVASHMTSVISGDPRRTRSTLALDVNDVWEKSQGPSMLLQMQQTRPLRHGCLQLQCFRHMYVFAGCLCAQKHFTYQEPGSNRFGSLTSWKTVPAGHP